MRVRLDARLPFVPLPAITSITTRVVITGITGYRWVWRLVTPDGHVANESEPFGDRASCEASALEQGLPVVGLTRAARNSPSGRVANDTPLWQFARDNNHGLWGWQRFDSAGHPIATSSERFSTQREAMEDAKLHGYVAKTRSRGRTNAW